MSEMGEGKGTMADSYIALRLAAIERELAELRQRLTRPKPRRRKSLRGVMKGKVEIEDVKAAAREIFREDAASDG